MFDLLTFTWIPGAICLGLLFLVSLFYPKLIGNKLPRISWCIQVAITLVILSPFVVAFMPGGGDAEQEWLNGVIAHLVECEETCEDERMREMIAYTIRRYDTIGPFGVRVTQLPENTLGLNSPFCRGVTLDEEVMDYNADFGAALLVHEAMHDHPPFFCHWHIDDAQIWRSVQWIRQPS
jgi:hypothetical protein